MRRQEIKRRVCVIYAGEDNRLAETLVTLLRDEWDVWFAEEHLQGDWRKRVRNELEHADAVVPLLSKNSQEKQILVDEWEFAVRHDKPVFPFIVEDCEIPFGMGGVNRTSAHGWSGNPQDSGYLSLRSKLRGHFGQEQLVAQRPQHVTANGKHLGLPAFVFSISSFETQLDPIDGVELLAQLSAPACLISAYDAHAFTRRRRTNKYWQAIDSIRASGCVLFLDSGNYEASRKEDYQSPNNPDGWSRDQFYEAAAQVDADIVFTYDALYPKGPVEAIAEDVIRSYERDMFKLGYGNDRLCPIVHVPMESRDVASDAASLVSRVATEIHPTFIAIPERELGDGLLCRMNAVRTIREKLNEQGVYQPLHLLGTGNPITIASLSATGGDCFDGLEWCRTAANYDTNNLLHFQHFDLLRAAFFGRIKNADARKIVDSAVVPFVLRVASYNHDYFCEWVKTIQRMIRAGETEFLLASIPNIGSSLVGAVRGSHGN